MVDNGAALAWTIIDGNSYMVLGTADAGGSAWVSPVWFATDDGRDFYWVSSPRARHSRNLAVRPWREEWRRVVIWTQSPADRASASSNRRHVARRPGPHICVPSSDNVVTSGTWPKVHMQEGDLAIIAVEQVPSPVHFHAVRRGAEDIQVPLRPPMDHLVAAWWSDGSRDPAPLD